MTDKIRVTLNPADYYMALQAAARCLYEVRLKNRTPKDSTQTSHSWLISNTVVGYMGEIAVAKYMGAYINQFMFYGAAAVDIPSRGIEVKCVCDRDGAPKMMVDLTKSNPNLPYVMVTYEDHDMCAMTIRGWRFGRDMGEGYQPERGGKRHKCEVNELLPMAALKDLWFNTEEYLTHRRRHRHESGIEE